MKTIFIILFLLLYCMNSFAGDRYYFSPVYKTKKFQQTWSSAFKKLPRYNQKDALLRVEKSKEVREMFNTEPNYFLLPLEGSYTNDNGNTWSPWEIGIAKVVMNATLRIDAVYGVDTITGKVTKLNRPTIHLPFEPNA